MKDASVFQSALVHLRETYEGLQISEGVNFMWMIHQKTGARVTLQKTPNGWIPFHDSDYRLTAEQVAIGQAIVDRLAVEYTSEGFRRALAKHRYAHRVQESSGARVRMLARRS